MLPLSSFSWERCSELHKKKKQQQQQQKQHKQKNMQEVVRYKCKTLTLLYMSIPAAQKERGKEICKQTNKNTFADKNLIFLNLQTVLDAPKHRKTTPSK